MGGVLLSILFLFTFKYLTAILSRYVELSESFSLSLAAPVGISFITFSIISFMIDFGSENEKVGFVDYCLYISFFPKILSGPICSPKDFLSQINLKHESVAWDGISRGMFCFSVGLAKKVLIADFLGIIVDSIYQNVWNCSGIEAVLVIISYSLQIYFDFSGYSDMAIGIACMFNVELPQNFNSPYQATDIIDFWKRWHITLTSFLTRYVYYPLGGNRKGKVRQYINILIVFLVSGIWHGVGLTFIVWGLLHGLINVLTRIIKSHIQLWKPISVILNFLIVSLLWVFFRSQTLAEAIHIISIPFRKGVVGTINADLIESLLQPTIFNVISQLTSANTAIMVVLVALLILVFACKNSTVLFERFRTTISSAIITFFLLLLSTLSFTNVTSFIYGGF